MRYLLSHVLLKINETEAKEVLNMWKTHRHEQIHFL